jgi:hypothetical protein
MVIETGGKVFVVGIFFGLMFAIFSACFSLNVYMQYCLTVTPLSFPFFTQELNKFMVNTVVTNFSRSYSIGMFVVLVSLYICV